MPEQDFGQPVGRVVSAGGEVWAEHGGEVRPLAVDAAIYADDVLVTDAGARLEVRFADDTLLAQGEQGRLAVDDYVFQPGDHSASELLFKMTQGTFRMVTGQIVDHNPDGVKLESPLGVIGIRGTTTLHDVDPAQDGQPGRESHGAEELTGGQSLILTDLFGNIQVISVPKLVEFEPGLPMFPARDLTPRDVDFFHQSAPLVSRGEQPPDETPQDEAPRGDETTEEPGAAPDEVLADQAGDQGGDGDGDQAQGEALDGDIPDIPDLNPFGSESLADPFGFLGYGLADLYGPFGAGALDGGTGLAREPGDVDTTTDDDTVPGATSSASTNWDDDGSTFNTTGYNVVDGTSGNDAALQGGAGNDVVRGFAGNDDLWGNSTGNDVLFGGAGDDTISGSDGNCSIWGGTGNDQIAGHNGNDTLVGGSGNDSFRWYQLTEIQGSLDQVKDFTKGVDTLYFSSAQFTKAGFVTDNSYTGGVSAAHTFIWNDSTHTLWYSDSGASGDSVAEFTNGVTLDTSDITVA